MAARAQEEGRCLWGERSVLLPNQNLQQTSEINPEAPPTKDVLRPHDGGRTVRASGLQLEQEKDQ